jgi:TolB-like protein/cytochrome c-type biogenesis protein CcmH/NrfG
LSFFAELRRRNVVRVGIAYVVGGWLLLQLTEVLSELLSLPKEIGPIVVAIVAIGFPIVLFAAWAFELTPEGVKREKDVDRSQSITPSTGKKLNNVILVLMALAIAYLLYDKFSGDRPDAVSTPAVAVAEPTATQETAPAPDSPAAPSRQSIAVLPFDNRSDQQSDAYFVEGIHDDLLTKLARIGSLKVISRTSVTRYQDTDTPIPDIARELGVATVMEGAVQRAGDTVRINVQLIDAATDEHLWAEIYDRELTTENLFAIQTEISEAIAAALQAELTPEEQQRINDRPTDNLAAYNAYLRGRQHVKSRDSISLEQAKLEFERALELDPEFAQAWVGVAEASFYSAGYGAMSMTEGMQIYTESADRALAINPDLGEAWAIKGSAAMMNSRWEVGESNFLRAIGLSPNDANVRKLYAEFLLQKYARLDDALVEIDKAIELDPFWAVSRLVGARTLSRKRDFVSADQAYRFALEINPNSAAVTGNYADFLDDRLEELPKALSFAKRAVELDPGSPTALLALQSVYLALGDQENSASVRLQIESIGPDHFSLGLADTMLQAYQGNFAAASESGMWAAEKAGRFPIFLFVTGLIQATDGKYERARQLMVEAYPQIMVTGEWDWWIPEHTKEACEAGWVLQRSGHEQMGTDLVAQSLAFVEEVVYPVVTDKHMPDLDICLAAAGEAERAITALEQRLGHGHIEDWWFDRRHPAYAGIKDDPRFYAAWERVEQAVTLTREQLASEGTL